MYAAPPPPRVLYSHCMHDVDELFFISFPLLSYVRSLDVSLDVFSFYFIWFCFCCCCAGIAWALWKICASFTFLPTVFRTFSESAWNVSTINRIHNVQYTNPVWNKLTKNEINVNRKLPMESDTTNSGGNGMAKKTTWIIACRQQHSRRLSHCHFFDYIWNTMIASSCCWVILGCELWFVCECATLTVSATPPYTQFTYSSIHITPCKCNEEKYWPCHPSFQTEGYYNAKCLAQNTSVSFQLCKKMANKATEKWSKNKKKPTHCSVIERNSVSHSTEVDFGVTANAFAVIVHVIFMHESWKTEKWK